MASSGRPASGSRTRVAGWADGLQEAGADCATNSAAAASRHESVIADVLEARSLPGDGRALTRPSWNGRSVTGSHMTDVCCQSRRSPCRGRRFSRACSG